METWKLLLLIALTLAGTTATAKYEASQYALQRKLSHVLLTLIRVAFGLLLIRMVLIPETWWQYLFPLLLLAGIFAPSHRILLWWFRTHRYKQRIAFTHLGRGTYDNLLTFLLPAEKTRYIAMSGIELFAAFAASQQL